MKKAICWASGMIEIASECPLGALVLASAPEEILAEAIQGSARLAYDGKTWLIPGVPEAAGRNLAVDAASAFAARLSARVAQLQSKRSGGG